MSVELRPNEYATLKEQTNMIEPEMQSRSGLYPTPIPSSSLHVLLEPVLTQAFVSQPILGNINLSTSQREKIHTVAKSTIFNALRTVYLPDYGLGDFSCDILVLETILLLRNWNDGDEDGSGDENENFWEYICNQYALAYDDNFGNSHVYKIFRFAITSTFKGHKRFIVNTGQKYYTTMLAHAFAPKMKFYALFEQIFAFYAKTLQYQYIKADPAFRAFSYAMNNRFKSRRSNSDDNVYIKSVQSSSAIKALFSHCPEYMADFVERAVLAIDTMIATGNIQGTSYLDTLLLDWYIARSREERSSDKRERSKASAEKVVTEFSSIRSIYRCDAGQISLIIPSIRLGSESDKQPWITIYRYPGDSNPYSGRLRFYGDYFCITSSRISVPIDELITEDVERIELRVVISYDGKDIYDSGSRLYRDAIAFGDDGAELSKRPDGEYINIFIPEGAYIEGEETSPDCTVDQCGKGDIYRVLINENTCIVVNGVNLFPIEQMVSGLTLNMSVAPVRYCRYLVNQQEYTIFTKQIILSVSSDNPAFEKQYRLNIDESMHRFRKYDTDSLHTYGIELPAGEGTHELRIIENATQHRVYTLRYVIIKNFSMRFEGFYYFDNYSENGAVEVSNCTGVYRYPYKILPGQQYMLIPYGEGDLSIDIPTLGCRLNGVSIPVDVQPTLWYKDIPMSALLEVDTPRGYDSTILIGGRTFMTDKVEIGNEIRTVHDSNVETVGVIINKEGVRPLPIKLFDIGFQPSFKSPPFLVEQKALLWCIEDNFVGDRDSEFEVSFRYQDNEIGRYRVGCVDEVISFDHNLEDGVYDYTIYMKSPGFFAKYQEFIHGQFIVGDPALFRFDGRAVIVTEAIIENQHIKLNSASGIITNLRYIGEQGLNGETQYYPCYEGCLQYKYDGCLRPYATNEYVRNGICREQVNPVKLWIINDYTISLRGPFDDGLYVNKKWSSITDRVPIKGINQQDYCNPDYYCLKIIPHSEVKDV